MKVQILVPVHTKQRILQPGLIIEIAESTLPKLAGKVRVLYHSGEKEPYQAATTPRAIVGYSPAVCQARKVGGRICGAPLRECINGHLSCSDPVCQAPATPHGLTPRATKYLSRH